MSVCDLAARGADEGLLARVGAHVHGEGAGLRETLSHPDRHQTQRMNKTDPAYNLNKPTWSSSDRTNTTGDERV